MVPRGGAGHCQYRDRRIRRPPQPLDEHVAELLRSPIIHQELEARMVAALPVAVIAKYLRNATAHIGNLLGGYHDVELLAQLRLRRETAAYAHEESDGLRVES